MVTDLIKINKEDFLKPKENGNAIRDTLQDLYDKIYILEDRIKQLEALNGK